MGKRSFSRRNFLKTSFLAAIAERGAIHTSAFQRIYSGKEGASILGIFQNKNRMPKDGVKGILFSQVGYEPDLPVKILIRLPKKELLPEGTIIRLFSKGEKYETFCVYWGEIWKSHWWIAEFPKVKEGKWKIEIVSMGKSFFHDAELKVKKNILWDSTIEWCSVDMLERRQLFTGLNAGWQDAGTLWVESPAQSAMIISLGELLERKKNLFNGNFLDRIYSQIVVGCDYLVMTQNKAKELGFSDGAMSHDLKGHERDILPHDAMKAVVALGMASRLLPEKYENKKLYYKETAKKAFNWLITKAKPMGNYGYAKIQRGLPKNAKIPENEWPTRDLIMMCRASQEMDKLEISHAKELSFKFAKMVMDRQIPPDKAENGFFGHFYEFDSTTHSEPSWTHGIVPSEKNENEFGTDVGGFYPNYLIPIIELLNNNPTHEDANKWKRTLKNFTYGYLVPACERNPFLIVPEGIYGDEGPLWFCGTFHGTNAIYSYTAALALDLAKLFKEPKLEAIAYGNIQWLAGLNAGITKESLKIGSIIYSTDVPEGVALPVSMICHIGTCWAGTWFQTRGVICNGFSAGKQFKYDTEPRKENDGPSSFTDEDWIPHSAAWLTALTRI